MAGSLSFLLDLLSGKKNHIMASHQQTARLRQNAPQRRTIADDGNHNRKHTNVGEQQIPVENAKVLKKRRSNLEEKLGESVA